MLHAFAFTLFSLVWSLAARAQSESAEPFRPELMSRSLIESDSNCKALINCDRTATLLIENTQNTDYAPWFVTGNDYAAFVTIPGYGTGPYYSIEVFRYDGSAWAQSETLSVRGPASASRDLLVTSSSLSGTTVYRCNSTACRLAGALEFGGVAATNGRQVAFFGEGTLRVYEENGGGEWIKTAEFPHDLRYPVIVAMDERRIALACYPKIQVYLKQDQAWVFEQELTLPELKPVWPAEGIGIEVIAVDGSHILVGNPGQCVTEGELFYCSAVYPFEWADGRWNASPRLHGSSPPYQRSDFGSSIVIRGNYAMIGAPLDPYLGLQVVGVVHVYKHTAGSWRKIQTISPPYATTGSAFGTTIALSQDHLILNAPLRQCGGRCSGQAWAIPLFGDDCDCNEIADSCEPDIDLDGVGGCDECPESLVDPLITIGICETDVENAVFPHGCTMSDFIAECQEQSKSRREYIRCVYGLAAEWRRDGLIDFGEAFQIRRCAR